MCLIIDNCVFDRVFFHNDPEFKPVVAAFRRGLAKSRFGSQLITEYQRGSKNRLAQNPLFAELERAGRLIRLSVNENSDVIDRTRHWSESGLLKSNDAHIIALAEITKQRLLVTADGPLVADFLNVAILKPKHSVYRNATHSRLLNRCCRSERSRRAKPRRKKN